jgi:hypothetical protein
MLKSRRQAPKATATITPAGPTAFFIFVVFEIQNARRLASELGAGGGGTAELQRPVFSFATACDNRNSRSYH